MTRPGIFRLFINLILAVGLSFSVLAVVDKVTSAKSDLQEAALVTWRPDLKWEAPLASPTPNTPHTLVGSYYTVEQGTNAKLMLNNKGASTLEVRPTIRSLSGQTLEVAPVYVDPQSFRFIDLQEWIDLGGPAFRSGSIELFHTGLDLVLGAQIYLEHRGRRLSFEEKLAEMGKFNSQKQEAIWFQPSEQTETKIVLSNKLGVPLTVTGNLSKAPRRAGDTQTFQLSAYETKFLDLKTDFSDGQQFANADMVGLSFTHTGAADALQARVFVYDRQVGYSNLAQFSNPNGGRSSEYQGVGFQIEDIAGLKLDPVIVVKNVGDQNSTVTAKIPYTKTDGSTGVIDLPQVTLRPAEMKRLDVQQIKQRVAQQSIQAAGLEIEYSTQPGSVIVSAHTQTADRDLIFRLPMWDPFAQKSPTGGYPWRIEGTSTTKTYIKNITNREQYYVAFLSWENGGRYMIGMKAVAPHQTIEIDVKNFRDEQIPDQHGVTIPLDATSGQLKWSLKRTMESAPEDQSRDMLALMGRTEQTDVQNGISSNYACQNWCENSYYDSYVSPGSPEVEVGQQVTFLAFQRDLDSYGCPGPYYQRIYQGSTNWTSSQTGTATLSGSNATGVGVGTTAITATWLDYQPPAGAFCEPEYMTANKESGLLGDTPITQPLSPPPPCEACATNPVWAHPSTVLTVKPKVRIDDFRAVGKTTDNISVKITNEDNQPVVLTIVAKTGTGQAVFAANNSATLTISQTTNVEIKGVTESSTDDNMRLEAKWNNRSLDTEDFTVLAVSLTLRFGNNDDVSSDNDKKQNHITSTGRSKLGGPFFASGTGNQVWGHSIEIVGTVLPNNYSGDIVLAREVVESKTYQGQTLIFQTGCEPPVSTPCIDTSFPDFLDATVSSQGRVFDLDIPGFNLIGATTVGTTRRRRVNFRQWATVSQKDGGTTQNVRMSADITWFHRLSVQYVGSPATQLALDVPNDNEIGLGTTPLTWNLLP